MSSDRVYLPEYAYSTYEYTFGTHIEALQYTNGMIAKGFKSGLELDHLTIKDTHEELVQVRLTLREELKEPLPSNEPTPA